MLVSGKGYDPLRINITANQDDNKVINTFDVRAILTSVSVSITTGAFDGDHLILRSNNIPDPGITGTYPSAFNNNSIYAQNYNHEVVYRGGKDIPKLNNDEKRSEQIGILANGSPLFSPDAGTDGVPPVGFHYNAVKTNFYDHDTYHGYPTN